MPIASKVTLNKERCARIGYKNLLVSADGQTPPLTLLPNTYERWLDGGGTATGVFQLAGASTIDYIAIGAHNLFSAGAPTIEISVSSTIGGAKTLVATIDVTSDDAIMFLFDSPITNVAEIEVFLPDAGTGIEIGIVYAGVALVMQQPIYGGQSPIDLSSVTEYQSVMSETGQFLGRNITKQGTETTFSWRHLDQEWYREYFQPFVESAKTLPFFIKWRPDLFDVAAFCHTTANIKPVNMGGGHKLMQVDVSVRGHSDP